MVLIDYSKRRASNLPSDSSGLLNGSANGLPARRYRSTSAGNHGEARNGSTMNNGRDQHQHQHQHQQQHVPRKMPPKKNSLILKTVQHKEDDVPLDEEPILTGNNSSHHSARSSLSLGEALLDDSSSRMSWRNSFSEQQQPTPNATATEPKRNSRSSRFQRSSLTREKKRNSQTKEKNPSSGPIITYGTPSREALFDDSSSSLAVSNHDKDSTPAAASSLLDDNTTTTTDSFTELKEKKKTPPSTSSKNNNHTTTASTTSTSTTSTTKPAAPQQRPRRGPKRGGSAGGVRRESGMPSSLANMRNVALHRPPKKASMPSPLKRCGTSDLVKEHRNRRPTVLMEVDDIDEDDLDLSVSEEESYNDNDNDDTDDDGSQHNNNITHGLSNIDEDDDDEEKTPPPETQAPFRRVSTCPEEALCQCGSTRLPHHHNKHDHHHKHNHNSNHNYSAPAPKEERDWSKPSRQTVAWGVLSPVRKTFVRGAAIQQQSAASFDNQNSMPTLDLNESNSSIKSASAAISSTTSTSNRRMSRSASSSSLMMTRSLSVNNVFAEKKKKKKNPLERNISFTMRAKLPLTERGRSRSDNTRSSMERLGVSLSSLLKGDNDNTTTNNNDDDDDVMAQEKRTSLEQLLFAAEGGKRAGLEQVLHAQSLHNNSQHIIPSHISLDGSSGNDSHQTPPPPTLSAGSTHMRKHTLRSTSMSHISASFGYGVPDLKYSYKHRQEDAKRRSPSRSRSRSPTRSKKKTDNNNSMSQQGFSVALDGDILRGGSAHQSTRRGDPLAGGSSTHTRGRRGRPSPSRNNNKRDEGSTQQQKTRSSPSPSRTPGSMHSSMHGTGISIKKPRQSLMRSRSTSEDHGGSSSSPLGIPKPTRKSLMRSRSTSESNDAFQKRRASLSPARRSSISPQRRASKIKQIQPGYANTSPTSAFGPGTAGGGIDNQAAGSSYLGSLAATRGGLSLSLHGLPRNRQTNGGKKKQGGDMPMTSVIKRPSRTASFDEDEDDDSDDDDPNEISTTSIFDDDDDDTSICSVDTYGEPKQKQIPILDLKLKKASPKPSGYGMAALAHVYGSATPNPGYGKAGLGYGDDDDDDDLGYGDAAPDTAPDLGYGDAAPDAAPDLGYGKAAPDLGYGNTKPDLGYGNAAPDLGYGDAQPDNQGQAYDLRKPTPSTVDLGYGDATPDAPETAVATEEYDYHDLYGQAPRASLQKARRRQHRASSMQHVSSAMSHGHDPTPRISFGTRRQRRRSNSMNMLSNHSSMNHGSMRMSFRGNGPSHCDGGQDTSGEFGTRHRPTNAGKRNQRRTSSMSMLKTMGMSTRNMGGGGRTMDTSGFVTGSRIRRIDNASQLLTAAR